MAEVSCLAQLPTARDTNIAALWLFDETNYTCTPLLDASPNQSDLRLLGAGQLTAGRYGNCLRLLPGTDFHAYYSEWDGSVVPRFMGRADGGPSGLWGPTITPGQLLAALAGLEWTCEFWLKLAAIPGIEAAVLHLGYGYDPGFAINLCGGAGYFSLTNAYGGWAAVCPIQNGSLTNGGWHHVAFTLSATGDRVKLYLDGQLQNGSTRSAIPLQPVPPTVYPASLATSHGVFDNTLNYELFRQNRFNLSLGEDRHGLSDLDGYLDELRISSLVRYQGNFALPGSFSRNYGSNPPPLAVVTGPPLLFGTGAPTGTVQLGARRHLFIDGALLDVTNNVRWTVNTPRVDVMSQIFSGDNSAVDHAGDVWLVTPDSYESDLGLTSLWESGDGTNFSAPNLGVINYAGSSNNNYILDWTPMWARAFKDRNPNIPTDERFKISAWVANSGIHLYTSPDLIHWSRNETIMLPLVSGGGAETFFDDQNGRYQFFIKRDPNMNTAGCATAAGRLGVGFTTRAVSKPWPFQPMPSPGFAGWASPAVTCEGPIVFGVNTYGEVYRTRTIKYEWAPDAYFAFLWRFTTATQVRQTELAISRDGVNWSGLAPLGMYLPTGLNVGGVTMVEGLCQQGLIRRGNVIWQYAEFNSGPHGNGAQKRNGRLVQRLDGFVSLDTTNTTGVARTRPLVFAGSFLTLNLDARNGVTRVALLNELGAPLPGYDLADCDPITTDSINHIVTWHGSSSLSNLAGSTVRLKLEMTRTKLYALQFGQPGPVVVDSAENWNGLENPHAVDGVTLTGAGTPANPYVYALPAGMTITANGVVRLSSDLAASNTSEDTTIRFFFAGGNLQMDAGAIIDVTRPTRSGQRDFLLDLNGGDMTGSGRIVGLRGPGNNRAQKPRNISITNVRDVNLLDSDLHTENSADALSGISIVARGKVAIQGKLDTSDLSTGGNAAGNIVVFGEQVQVNNLDTRAFRADGQAANGYVDLRALDANAGYDTTSAANAFTNRLVLNGSLRLAGLGPNLTSIVRLYGVVVQLNGGYSLALPGNGLISFRAGVPNLGTPPDDLFINASSQNPPVGHVVNWDGVPPASTGPSFTTNPIVLSSALAGLAYSNSIASLATDPDGNPLAYAKGSGPAWLLVALDGTLSGTPTLADVGTNTWLVSVTDGSRSALATLKIKVGSKPIFTASPIVKAAASQGMPYAGTLANVTYDPDGDTLTFAKESGSGWLTVAADGALSGTPNGSDTFTNLWIVSATDGSSSNAAMLLINVCGEPKFFVDPVAKEDAWASNNYAIAGQTLASSVADPCGQPLTFAKAGGPSWLSVSPDGSLSGTPANGDAGLNTWTVTANDGTYTATGALRILVHSAATNIVISTVEQWDGVQNPHAADGVTLSGSGTDADPAVYTMAANIRITSTGGISISARPPAGGQDQPPDNTVMLRFLSGNLQMDNGAFINIARRSRSGVRHAILSMGRGNITGAGRINGLWDIVSTPRILTINDVHDVSLSGIDLHVENVNNSGRHLTITASGKVSISTIDNSDRDLMGNDAGDVNINAEAILVGGINVAAYRADGVAKNGDIRLSALASPLYDLTAAAANTAQNRLVLTGLVFTAGTSTNRPGNVTLAGVIVETKPGFQLQMPPTGALTLNAGMYPNGVGAKATDMFIDRAGSGLTPAYIVQWSGQLYPRLTITHSGTNVVLQWNVDDYTLQENSTLTNPLGWTNLPDLSPATRPVGSNSGYYRLKR